MSNGVLWTLRNVSTSPRFWLSGWSRLPVDPNLMCGECACKWSAGRWFPRFCQACRYVRANASDVCGADEHADCMLPGCACDCHGR